MKSKFTANLLAFLLAAFVIAAGIVTPNILLHRQEKDILENKKILTLQEKQPILVQKTNTVNPEILYGKELLTRFSLWNNWETQVTREPRDNELSMEGAFSIAKSELQKLMDANAIPSIPIQEYQLRDAQLKGKLKSALARWELKLAYLEDTAQLEIDAETGNIYSVVLAGHKTNDISSRDRLVMFAKCYGIMGENPVAVNNDSGVLEAVLKTEIPTIYVSSSASSGESLKYTVKMESLQNPDIRRSQ